MNSAHQRLSILALLTLVVAAAVALLCGIVFVSVDTVQRAERLRALAEEPERECGVLEGVGTRLELHNGGMDKKTQGTKWMVESDGKKIGQLLAESWWKRHIGAKLYDQKKRLVAVGSHFEVVKEDEHVLHIEDCNGETIALVRFEGKYKSSGWENENSTTTDGHWHATEMTIMDPSEAVLGTAYIVPGTITDTASFHINNAAGDAIATMHETGHQPILIYAKGVDTTAAEADPRVLLIIQGRLDLATQFGSDYDKAQTSVYLLVAALIAVVAVIAGSLIAFCYYYRQGSI